MLLVVSHLQHDVIHHCELDTTQHLSSQLVRKYSNNKEKYAVSTHAM